MRLDLLQKAAENYATGGVHWLIGVIEGTEPLDTQPLSKSEAMAIAQAHVSEHGGSYERYQKIHNKIGLKRLWNEEHFSNVREANQQIMAKNRLKRYGVKVPEFYGFVYAKSNNGWYTYGVMEHIDGEAAAHAANWEFGGPKGAMKDFLMEVGCGHADLHGWNVMVAGADRRLVVIDWESERLYKTTWGDKTRFTRITRRAREA